jgi:UDP-N-acetylglucosamine--N-acetylmuramyl-(pentapeptide) pyrophosphoryl-undecaprenol N-acetylglucosamine transferase
MKSGTLFPKEKMILTGNPVRQVRYRKQKRKAIQHFNLDSKKKTVLVLGGSLGARRVNQLIEKSWQIAQNVQVIWQCGKLYLEDYKI